MSCIHISMIINPAEINGHVALWLSHLSFTGISQKAPAQHVYVWEEEWAVVSRDDVDGDSPILIHELPSAESSDNDKTFELPDDYIITVWLHEE